MTDESSAVSYPQSERDRKLELRIKNIERSRRRANPIWLHYTVAFATIISLSLLAFVFFIPYSEVLSSSRGGRTSGK